MAWTLADAGSQKGRTFIVTGSNAGLGFENAKDLARLGGRVVMACRNEAKANAALARIRTEVPDADVRVSLIDTSSLASVRDFAGRMNAELDRLDGLVNNAGVMIPPLGMTEDGFELQFASNYVGHFLLTGLLLPKILATKGSRVVTLASLAHWFWHIEFDNLSAEKGYDRGKAYSQSKLACLIFARELQRRLEKIGASTISLSSHPGGTATELSRHSRLLQFLSHFAQSVPAGALPTLRALLDPKARGGEYYGPLLEYSGRPHRSPSSADSKDPELARRLWERTEEMTGIRYP